MSHSRTMDSEMFHERTKYVLTDADSIDASIQMGIPPDLGPAMGEQDPALEPSPYKRYRYLQSVPLPVEPIVSDMRALDAIAASGAVEDGATIPSLTTLAQVLFRTGGLLKEWTTPLGRQVAFRAAGCTGARYHLEMYVVCGDLDGLPAGVYHYGPQNNDLQILRSGDHRATLIDATGAQPSIALAPAILIVTSEFWRNAWRYQERAYRHAFWDLGTLLTNTIAIEASLNLPTEVVLGFADDPVNRLIGVDGEREAALGLVSLGRQSEPPQPVAIDSTSPPMLEVEASSPREIAFPDIEAVHRASALDNGDAASAWRSNPLVRTPSTSEGKLIDLRPFDPADVPDESIEDVIVRRRSNRHYDSDEPLSFIAFSTVLDKANKRARIDAIDKYAPSLSDLYLIVNNVEGLDPGVYVHHPELNAVELLKAGEFLADAQRLACGQGYAADVHVNGYLLADLDPILDRYGDRGYRLAQFEAALTGGRLQLAAHALRLGAVGSTSADDEVTEFFSPHAAGKSFMFVCVFGNRRKPSHQETQAASRFLNRDREA